jgi:hypothetical protein
MTPESICRGPQGGGLFVPPGGIEPILCPPGGIEAPTHGLGNRRELLTAAGGEMVLCPGADRSLFAAAGSRTMCGVECDDLGPNGEEFERAPVAHHCLASRAT